VWYPECEALATKLGHTDLFAHHTVDWITEGLAKTRKLCEYWHEHGRWPNWRASQKITKRAQRLEEQNLIGFKNRMRALRVLGYPPFEKEWRMACETLANELGCPNLFIPTDFEERALNNTIAVIKFIKAHGKYPNAYLANKTDRSLGGWINNAIRTRNGYCVRYKWYPECEVVAEALGMPDLFRWRAAPSAAYYNDYSVVGG
jgi:hypothetical protein